jgi:hypothetical protein
MVETFTHVEEILFCYFAESTLHWIANKLIESEHVAQPFYSPLFLFLADTCCALMTIFWILTSRLSVVRLSLFGRVLAEATVDGLRQIR